MPAPAKEISAADLRSIMDPLDVLGMEDEYRAAVSAGAGGVTTSTDVVAGSRPLDADILEGIEERAFEDGDLLPMEKVVGTDAFKGTRFITPSEGDGELAAEYPNELGAASNHELRIVYDCQGRQQPVQFAKLRHYLSKPCAESHHKHRAFYPSLAQAQRGAGAGDPVVPTIPCKLPRCRKMFDSTAKRDDHFRHRHPATYAREQDERRISAEEANLKTQAGILQVLERLAPGATAEMAPMAPRMAEVQRETVKAATRPKAQSKAKRTRATPQLAPRPEGNPDESWKVYHITDWLKENGHPLPEKTFGMKAEEWLKYAWQFVKE